MSDGKRDQDWAPSRAVKNWAKRYAQKQYQRKEGKRLIKLDSKSKGEQGEIEKLEGATGSSVEADDLSISDKLISRTHSLEAISASPYLEETRSLREFRIRHLSDDSRNILETEVALVPFSFTELSSKSSSTTEETTQFNMSPEELEAMLQRVGLGERDNHKLLPPLPYFNGSAAKTLDVSARGPWIVYNCEEFLAVIEASVNNDRWTEAGKLKTLQDKLLGSARDYWSIKGPDINTLAKAREYLLKRYPNKDTHTSLDHQITNFKRNRGETIPELATRVQVVYEKLGKAVPESKAIQQRNMKELFLKNLPEVVRDQVKDGDTYDEVVEKSITYLERHKELKLRDQDVLLETTFKAEAKVNNMNTSNKGTEEGDKRSKGNKKGNTNKSQRSNSGNEANINNINTNQNNHPNQRGARGNNRRSFRGRGRVSFRGNYNNYNNDSYNNSRGRGNYYRGSNRGFRNQRFRGYYRGNGGNRGYTRGNFSNNRNQNFNSYDNARGPQCYNCNGFGHFARDCRKGQNGNNNRNNGESQTQNQSANACYICGSDQHFARNCPQKN